MSNEIKEPTAFYRQCGIDQTPLERIGFDYKTVYDDLYKAMLPHLFEHQRQPRVLASIGLAFIFDIVTTAMAIAKYDEEHTFEKDIHSFIEALMIMLGSISDGVGANARLLIDKKSIFNIREKQDS